MDQTALVDGGLIEGGAEGLTRIAQAFRSRGIDVSGVYLIKLTSGDDSTDWVVRLVTSQQSPGAVRKMISELVQLRRENALPLMDPRVRMDIVSSEDPEAARVMDYARRLGSIPTIIRDVMWNGLFIEYALVAMIPHPNMAVA